MDLTSFGVEKKNKAPKEINDNKLELDINKIKKDFSSTEIERYLPWFLKYKLDSYDKLIITPDIKKIINYVENFKPNSKSFLLYGSPGCGKTTTLTLIGEHFGYEIFELNASDARNKKSITEKLGDVIRQKSLFGKSKLILIDEADGIAGNEDRGGLAEITKLQKISPYPIVFTANDGESDKLKPLKKIANFINFENHSKEILEIIGKRIFDNEKIKYDKNELSEFADNRNTSDIRGFINDLQASVSNNEFKPDSNLEIRDYKRQIENLLEKIYFSYPEDSYKSSFNTSINIDDLFLYIEENTPNAYSNKSLIEAFNEISKADIFKGRIMKWQYWRYLVYINFYLTYAISSAKTSPQKKLIKKNSRILKKWIYSNKVLPLRPRTKAEKKKDLPERFIEKLSKYYSNSVKSCRSSDLTYFVIMYKNNEEFQKAFDEKLSIDAATKKALLEYT